MKNRASVSSVCVIFFILAAAAAVQPAIPQKINFQGLLTDNDSNPLVGSHTLIFKIYDSLAGGTALWQETQTLNVSSGVLNAQLGNTTLIPADSFDSPDRWLEINVDGNTLSPRQQFYSHPYCYVAEKAYGLTGSMDSITLGSDITAGTIKHRSYDAIRLEEKKIMVYKDVAGAMIYLPALSMDGNKISQIGPLGPSGIGMTMTGDGNNYMRIIVSSSDCTNAGLYIGADNGKDTGEIKLNSKNIFSFYKFFPGTTAGGGFQNNVFIVAQANNILTSGGWAAGGSDLAEYMSAETGLEPGDVTVINGNSKLAKCAKEYDPLVIGVISDKPGVLLGNSTETGITAERKMVALSGRVYIKADAGYGPIKAGDMLTTSSTPGYAMKAKIDSFDKLNTIIGKALEPLDSGKSKILVLVTQR